MLMHWHLRMQVLQATIRCDERHPPGVDVGSETGERNELLLGGEPRYGAHERDRARPRGGRRHRGTGLPTTPWPCVIHGIADMARRTYDAQRSGATPQ